MKRSIIIGLSLALALGACSKGVEIGKDLVICKAGQTPEKDKCVRQEDVKPTATPTPTKARSNGPKATKTTKPPPVKPCAYTGKTYTVVINDVYEQYKPATLRVLRGDYIVFKNNDPTNPHSMTVTGGGPDLDTGIIQPGKSSRKMRAMVAVPESAGSKRFAEWYDRQIEYIRGGPLDIVKNPLCKG